MNKLQTAAKAVAHIVDDDAVVLESIGLLLMSMDIAYRSYPSASDFLAGYDSSISGCLILDVRMPGMSGLELQEFLNAGHIAIPIIFISGHSDVPVAVRAMKHGAIEFLQKPFAQEDLLEAVERAFAMDWERLQTIGNTQDFEARLRSLSSREQEILDLLVEGLSAKEIGKQLSISPRTVEYHRTNVLEKTNTHSIVSLAGLVGKLAK